MQKIVCVKEVKIGEGIPKICVPIVETETKGILREAEKIAAVSPDLVEWRADFFQNIENPEEVEHVMEELDKILDKIPLLFTFRSAEEGGSRSLSYEAYRELNCLAAGTKKADLVDVEYYKNPELSKRLILELHGLGVKVIASYHNFQETPKKEEIIRRLLQMNGDGADILKLAAMPQNEKDLLELLAATNELREKASQPVVTMSMGPTGALSRICGAVFGSAVTFGSVGQTSAPGQIPVEELRGMLANIQRYCR